MQKLIGLFKNKYFIAVAVFVVWMTFFDRNDFITQYDYSTQISKFEKEKAFYTEQNAIINKELAELGANLNTAEKFAREKYFMKRDNEDVFVIVEQTDSLKK